MLNKSLLIVAAAAGMTAFAASNNYKVSILQDTIVEGKQVKAGDYKLELTGNTATLKHGKEMIEVPARSEQSQSKYASTQVQYVENALHEIHIGGTTTKIVFDSAGAGTTGGSN